ncbi:hypothetical protein [Capnocytophaga cynodegmi]|uniref:hypothetical protein n=1 Tax=Capnocytophaga cynodegmi TaxID=28189 RepID=UPI00385D01F1
MLRDTSLRWANEPKQSVFVFWASSLVFSLKGMLSQATFSRISYFGMPSSSTEICTEPVGKGTSSSR